MQLQVQGHSRTIQPDVVYLVNSARLLICRLERISVDSTWAHRSSGLRGTLLRLVEEIEARQVLDESNILVDSNQISILNNLIEMGFSVLEKAAREY